MEYQLSVIDDTLFKGINLLIKDKNETILGGIVGKKSLDNVACIEHLWVDEKHRGKDLGTYLLCEFEEIAKKQGCNKVCLDTFDFQAPLFYEKNGYQLFEILADSFAGYKRFYYSKQL